MTPGPVPISDSEVGDHWSTLSVCHMSKTSSDISDFSLKLVLSFSSLQYLHLLPFINRILFHAEWFNSWFFLFAAQPTNDKLDDFIATINSMLQPMFMQIRKGMSEDNGQQYFALVSRTSLWPACIQYIYIWPVDVVLLINDLNSKHLNPTCLCTKCILSCLYLFFFIICLIEVTLLWTSTLST